jgi:cytochrome c peroxidase
MILRGLRVRAFSVVSLVGLVIALDGQAGDFQARCQKELSLPKSDCVKLERIGLPASLPKLSGNQYADSDAAAEVGFVAFFDPNFSRGRKVSCASCHSPEFSYTDHKKTAVGIGVSTRNAPSLLNAARHSKLFWDGRADSLISQPLFAIENESEMAFTRIEMVHVLGNGYRQRYEKLFGPLPDVSKLPKKGKPGDPEYDQLSPETKAAVDQVARNFGKMMSAFVRKLAAGPSEVDHYIAGRTFQLFPQARQGMAVFARKGCLECHSGPNLTDEKFRKMDSLAEVGAKDIGAGARDPSLMGMFRTPSLRNLNASGPYGHNGEWADLSAAIRGHRLAVSISAQEENDLILFLMSLSGKFPERPWSGWPSLH